uniref:POX-I n=1 Tax=Spodoptera exigua TaxID=7107 RepID=A0A088MTF6_SPOEX|nr:POX-I [Spodoptera exigua]
MQANVGPTRPPTTGLSAIPAVNRSISSTCLYSAFIFLAALAGITLSRSSKSSIVDNPQGSLHDVYGGTPWSLPL